MSEVISKSKPKAIYIRPRDLLKNDAELINSQDKEIQNLRGQIIEKDELLRNVLDVLVEYGHNPDGIQEDIADELGIDLENEYDDLDTGEEDEE